MARLFGRGRGGAADDAGAGGGVGGASPLDAWFALQLDEEQAWASAVPGPPLADVEQRLSSAPSDVLDPRADMVALGGDVIGSGIRDLVPAMAHDAARRGAGLALWLLASQELVEPFAPRLARDGRDAVAALALRLAPVVDPALWLADEQRRQEASRLFLLWSGALPAGEDAATARARWDRLDSIAHDAALREMVAEQQHRLAVLAALREQRAKEAAARYSPE